MEEVGGDAAKKLKESAENLTNGPIPKDLLTKQ